MKQTKLCKEAFEIAYTKVCILQQRIAALHYAVQGIKNHPYSHKAADREFGELHSALYDELNHAYNSLFMWGIVIGDKESMVRAKQAAFDQYLRENSGIMEYLEMNGEYPAELEKEFREELENLKNDQ